MTNFRINFERPWFLLLLIPALILTLLPYFRLAKKYRRTRNRVVSIVLHTVIMALSISVLSGITIQYDLPNVENEVILLVDTSFSGSDDEAAKNEFIEEVVNSNDGSFKLGIVTFGYNQVYASELTENKKDVFAKYLAAERPDDTATDIASALNYASTLFTKPETARIVVISDGIQTDGSTASMIKQLASTGIKVDTVCFPNGEVGNEVLILNTERPEENIRVGQEFELAVTLKSSYAGTVNLIVYDNEQEIARVDGFTLVEGDQVVPVKMQFTLPGLHALSFEMESVDGKDTLNQNNVYSTHFYLEIFDKLLIIESIDGQSSSVKTLLGDELNVTVINASDVSAMPTTVEQLRAYDEVILYNVARSDMPEGFEEILYTYVYEIGGGLFTVCGNKVDGTANAFTEDDMIGSKYQEMLPVEVIEYTPPVAVMIVIDCSGSMSGGKLEAAKAGAKACLDALTERDYVGIMSLADSYTEDLELTPRTQRAKILAAIDELELKAQTIYEGALRAARTSLLSLPNVERRHIIFVTDGQPQDKDAELYLAEARLNAEAGITISAVGVEANIADQNVLKELLREGGCPESNYYQVNDIQQMGTMMREDLEAPAIKDVNYETYTPIIKDLQSSVVNGITQDDMFTLDGFYGSKPKNGADVILSAKYVPIYAQWRFGKGMVGSFMCDINGTWSAEMISSSVGEMLVKNIVTALFPAENIRLDDIELEIKEGNYNNQLSIFTSLNEEEGQSIRVTVTSPNPIDPMSPIVKTYTAGTNGTYSRMSFDTTTSGLHEILVEKLDAQGKVLSSATTYRSFSYSKEYDPFHEPEEGAEYMAELSKDGKGEVIANDDPWGVFENVVKFLHIVIDPRIIFILIVLIFFLTDIAVRKFKFKWPHEIYRSYKMKKEMNQK